jgi:hypothetical protein
VVNYVSIIVFVVLGIVGAMLAGAANQVNPGDRDAAMNLAAAARTMAESPGAMQLRTLQSIDGLGPSASNTVVLAVPVDVMEVGKSLAAQLKRPSP